MANSNGGYGQFCPVSMAAELVCTRWTINVIRELLQGSSRFNDLRRGLPRMSPALLSKRLKELEAGGIIERTGTQGQGGVSYVLTPAGNALGDVVESIGRWGHRWLETHLSLQNLDPSLLMWDMRRRLNPDPMPPGRAVIQFVYPELSATRRQWWLLVDKGKDVDLCSIDPGFDVNLYVVTALRTMTSIWMGLSTLEEELNRHTVRLTGDAALQQSMSQWLGLNHFAKAERH
jgi:DNA-binding HxlR family transcriptional regulator